jgi:multidrug resistance efflux pump
MSTLDPIIGQDSGFLVSARAVEARPPASGGDFMRSIDEQLRGIDEHLQHLLRKDSPAPPAHEIIPAAGSQSPSQTLPPLPSPAPKRRSIASRLVRPALGIGLLGLAAWSLVPLLLTVQSRQAVVNVPVVTLRSPIDGVVTFLCGTASGVRARANAPILEVRNVLADDDRLDALKDEKALLEARIKGHQQQLADLSSLRESLADSARRYQEARLRTLELECEGARALVKSAQAVQQQRLSEEEMLKRLQDSHSVSGQDTAASRFASEAARHSVAQAEKSVANIEEQIRALRGGIHVGPGDGRNDLPYSAQRLHEIGFRMEETRATLRQDEAKLAQLVRHIRGEEERLALRSQFTAKAPVDGVVWRRYVVSGSTVKADSPLLDLIDPGEIFIDAVISEQDLSRVRPGDTAEVQITGCEKKWQATVRQLVGRSLPWPNQLLAADAVPASRQEVHAILRFREPPSGDHLPVGLPAAVTFSSTPNLFQRPLAHRGS